MSFDNLSQINWSAYMKTVVGLIAILNPMGAVPVFVTLTSNHTDSERARIVKTATLTVFAVLSTFMLLGEHLLGIFGISLDSFRVAGGILILLMAISMLTARQSRFKATIEEEQEAEARHSIAIVPLAIPMLSGPGAISTVILYSNLRDTVNYKIGLFLAILIAVLFVSLCLRLAPKIAEFVGKTGINIVTRIMGLIMAANGVEFMADGLIKLFPGLAH